MSADHTPEHVPDGADEPRRARGFGRRQLLRTGAAALGGTGVGWVAASAATGATGPAASTTATGATTTDGSAAGSRPEVGMRTVAFHGAHQAGVATPPQAYLTLLGLDLHDVVDREALGRMMRLLSDDASRLSRGVAALADNEPELAERPASLSVTFGFGPRVVREHFSGTSMTLEELPAFSTDRLEDAWGQTDVAVQICCDDPLTLAHCRRMLLKDSRAFADVRWMQEGYRRAVGTEAEGTTVRNVMGQVDGTVNPAETDDDFSRLIWSEESGFEGGSVMIVRRIRARMESWDKVDRAGRENTVGRRLDTGAPLTGTKEHDTADFSATDELGFKVIDPASHIARATARTPEEKFLRRPYNYTVPDVSRPSGEDAGLVFIAYAADPVKQFVPVQQRLAELDRLNEWITTIGSAVYAVPPGAADGEAVAQHLLAT
ncbi:Dyp-type peroxidase [Nocardioides bruguierae]|uniref:Dyp-type peroxidase n=1 Tax=Nocardioides bruguierae TaxID=2945102 RepID=A0A9X2IDX1_9ACTN|nr:Dyp-type peroxidase [Nocardioides bruguierae]MCM0620211.1 Dyp-type peroxidase [Nocardioides bruguierae]